MGATTRRRWENGIPAAVQRSILFLAGLLLLVNEALGRPEDLAPRWHLLVVYVGMMGFPLAQRADDLRQALTPPDAET